MMQKVNSVMVSNAGVVTAGTPNAAAVNTVFAAILDPNGQYVVADATTAATAKELYIGLVTGSATAYEADGTPVTVNQVQYSRPIQKGSISNLLLTPYSPVVEDSIEITFPAGFTPEVGYSYTLRIVRTDIYENPQGGNAYSYTYVARTTALADLINYFVKKVNKDLGNGVTATGSATAITLTAQAKDDSEGLHPVNLYSQVTIDAFMYMTVPSALLSLVQYPVPGVTIAKTAGTPGTGNPKIVRDRENYALAYRGIQFGPNAIYPYIAPELNVDLSESYDTLTIEYDNKYLSNDNQYIKTTPLAVEVYVATDAIGKASALEAVLEAFIG